VLILNEDIYALEMPKMVSPEKLSWSGLVLIV